MRSSARSSPPNRSSGHWRIATNSFDPSAAAAISIGGCSIVRPDYLIRAGFSCVLWNVVPRDWEDAEAWVDRALRACAAPPQVLLVLHDTLFAAMKNLDGFIQQLKDQGHTIAQEFPAACVPILRGSVVQDMSRFVSEA